MFGAILEKSNGAEAIARYLTDKMGMKNAPISILMTGFIVAIPVFFDVAFIILIPVIYAMQRKTKKSLLLYAIPLLTGLAITHAFIPPPPGPVAVADIIKVDLGWVIIVGFLAGIPTAIVSGLFFGKYIAEKIHIDAKIIDNLKDENIQKSFPHIGLIISITLIPIVLILIGTMIKSGIIHIGNEPLKNTLTLLGHPFSALIIANLIVWYVLGIGRGFSAKELSKITSKSMEAAGIIILLTGAGGVFKQVLVETGAGVDLSQGELAAIVIAIASGASILSQVNDSGFWLVKEYLGMDEKQTFRS
jgi:Gnt-I system low-affinity gluconate transporter